MLILIIAIVLFIIADVLIRYTLKKIKEKNEREERLRALESSLKLDFSEQAKTLKRVGVENPKARILCVDDESVVLDSFRKILVLDFIGQLLRIKILPTFRNCIRINRRANAGYLLKEAIKLIRGVSVEKGYTEAKT